MTDVRPPMIAPARPDLPTWWHADPSILAFPRSSATSSPPQLYQFGDGVLQLHTPYARLRDALARVYAESAISKVSPAAIRLTAHAYPVPHSSLLRLRFECGADFDFVDVALGLLQNHHPEHSVHDSPVRGWRLISRVAAPDSPLLAVSGADTLIDTIEEPPEFLVNYLIATLMRLQAQMLFMHAGSMSIGGRGILLAGKTHAGKTTTTLTLASRGHGFLGDDVAAIRINSRELVPFLRAASIRPAPRSARLERLIAQHAYPSETLPDGTRRTWLRVTSVLPRASSAPAPLRAAFFLRGFAANPACESFDPSLQNYIEVLKVLSYEHTVSASWGLAAGRRLMRFATLSSILKHVPCYLLDAGTTEDTADFIETTMEKL